MCQHYDMVSLCEKCGHRLWLEKHPVESIRATLYFDDDETSDTHAEHVTHCPGCGVLLGAEAMIPEEILRHGPTHSSEMS